MEGVLYPALAGTFGALSVLFAKSVTEAVRLTVKGENQLLHVQPYMMAGAMGGCVFLQLKYLNTSLTKAGACVGTLCLVTPALRPYVVASVLAPQPTPVHRLAPLPSGRPILRTPGHVFACCPVAPCRPRAPPLFYCHEQTLCW